jgi:hypothetical protein
MNVSNLILAVNVTTCQKQKRTGWGQLPNAQAMRVAWQLLGRMMFSNKLSHRLLELTGQVK